MDFLTGQGVGAPNPQVVQDSTVIAIGHDIRLIQAKVVTQRWCSKQIGELRQNCIEKISTLDQIIVFASTILISSHVLCLEKTFSLNLIFRVN